MADYSYARLQFGQVPADKRAGLLEAIQTDGAFSTVDDDEVTSLDDLDENTIYDNEARWGNFRYTEGYCMENDIGFDRYSASCSGAWDASWTKWRPGMDEPLESDSNDNQEELASAILVAEAREQVRNGNWAEAINILDHILQGYDVPELESGETNDSVAN